MALSRDTSSGASKVSTPAKETKDAKEVKTTSYVTAALQKAHAFLAPRYPATDVNPKIPKLSPDEAFSHANEVNGVGKIVTSLFRLAKQHGKGVAELIPMGRLASRVVGICDPKKMALLYTKAKHLEKCDASGFQPAIFGLPSIVNQPVDTKEYKELRGAFKNNVFDPVATFIPFIHKTFEHYFYSEEKKPEEKKTGDEAKAAAPEKKESSQSRFSFLTQAFERCLRSKEKKFEKNELPDSQAPKPKHIPDMKNVAERFAISVMAKNPLGIDLDGLTEDEKTTIANTVHHLVDDASIPVNAWLLPLENAIEKRTGINIHLARHLGKLRKQGDELLKAAIKKNEAAVFERIQHFTKNITSIKEYQFKKPSDMYTRNGLGLIKLILAGGFETTSKLLLHLSMILGASNPKYQAVKKKLREELEAYVKKTGRGPHEWTDDDFNQLKYLNAVVYEILRLYPPFTYMKQGATEDFELDGINILAGDSIITSPFDAHRDPNIYKNPEEFNPDRWLEEEFKDFNIDTAPSKDYFFTFGRLRACPGRRIPHREARVIGARLAWFFDINIKVERTQANGEKKANDLPDTIDEYLQKGFTLELQPDVTVSATLTPRDFKLAPEKAKDLDSDRMAVPESDEAVRRRQGFGLGLGEE